LGNGGIKARFWGDAVYRYLAVALDNWLKNTVDGGFDDAIGTARYVIDPGRPTVNFAVIFVCPWQTCGIKNQKIKFRTLFSRTLCFRLRPQYIEAPPNVEGE